MLKRLSSSFTKDAQQANDLAFLSPPTPGFRTPGLASPRSSPKRASFPFDNASSYPSPIAPAPPAAQTAVKPASAVGGRSIERPVLHKTLTNLSSLLVALDELRGTSQAHSKARKHVAKATRDLADGFKEKSAGLGGRSDEVAEALVSCATMLEALQEVEEKHAKSLRKEYEAMNDLIARYFRKTAKEERAHEDRLADLDARVAKATASYQSTARTASASSGRDMHAALDSMTTQHSSYMHELSALSTQINHVKAAYAGEVAGRREVATREVASALCAMTEREWRQDVEAVRRGAESIGRLVSAAVWVAQGMDRVEVAAPRAALVKTQSLQRNNDAPVQPLPLESPAFPRSSRVPSSDTIDSTRSPSVADTAAPARGPPSVNTSQSGFSSLDAISSSGSSKARSIPTSTSWTTGNPSWNNSHQPRPFSTAAAHGEPDTSINRPREPPEPILPLAGVAASSPLNPTSDFASRDGHTSADARPQAVLDRQDSFVARMSRKYGQSSTEQAAQPVLNDRVPSRHIRSDSRVSQLAKRYSAPPYAAGPHSPPILASTSPPRSQTRPQWIGSPDDFNRSSRDLSDPQQFAAHHPAAATPQTAAAPRSSTPSSARLRAYQMAQTLPR